MTESINTHPAFEDVKVGSLVYCKTRFGEDWLAGLVVKKYNVYNNELPKNNGLCFRVLVEGETYCRFSLRQLMLIETGGK